MNKKDYILIAKTIKGIDALATKDNKTSILVLIDLFKDYEFTVNYDDLTN